MSNSEHPISKFRAERKMTLNDFASLVGVKKSAVSKWEAGRGPSPKLALKIESETGISKTVLRPDFWPPADGAMPA